MGRVRDYLVCNIQWILNTSCTSISLAVWPYILRCVFTSINLDAYKEGSSCIGVLRISVVLKYWTILPKIAPNHPDPFVDLALILPWWPSEEEIQTFGGADGWSKGEETSIKHPEVKNKKWLQFL